MALYGKTVGYIPARPKRTRQGKSSNSKLSASSRNGRKKAVVGRVSETRNPQIYGDVVHCQVEFTQSSETLWSY